MPTRLAFSDNCRISCLGPPTANSDLEDDDDGQLTCLSNYSYHKLPAHLLKLSILKLDGSVFDVIIEKNASLGQLKHAIEDVFISSPDVGQGKISWSHVWGHFCLCFGDQKLLNDRTYITNLGIKDGDQLQFVHHLSVNYSPKKRRAKNPNGSSIQRPSGGSEESSGDEKELFDLYNDEMIQTSEFRLSHMVRGWLPSSRSVSRRPSSRFGMQCLGGGTGMVRL